MRKYILILLALVILSGCHADTAPETDTPDTAAQTEESTVETETVDTETDTTAETADTEPDTEAPPEETTNTETETTDTATDTTAPPEETTPETTDEETPLTTFPYFQITHNNSSYVCVEGFEPPVLEPYFHDPMPDFLTEEQKVLYCCAQTLYNILRGSTLFIDDFPKKDGTPFTPGYGEGFYIERYGLDMRYYVSTGRYAKWDDFVAMGQSVFTDDYFKKLSDGTFFEDNGKTCYLDAERGGPWGYVPEFAPDTFTLLSQTETQIDFIVTAYYFDSFHPTKDDIPEEISFPIQLVLTENGWRFSYFDSGGIDSTDLGRILTRKIMPVIQWFAYRIVKIGFDENDRITTEDGHPYFRINDPAFTEAGIHSIATLREYLLEYFSTAYTDAILERYSHLFLESNDALYIEGAYGANSIYYTIDYYAGDRVSDTEYTFIVHTTKHTINNFSEPTVMEFTFIRERNQWVCDASPDFRNCALIHW